MEVEFRSRFTSLERRLLALLIVTPSVAAVLGYVQARSTTSERLVREPREPTTFRAIEYPTGFPEDPPRTGRLQFSIMTSAHWVWRELRFEVIHLSREFDWQPGRAPLRIRL